MNEYPFIRYYVPSHHQPLGALRPHANTRPAPPPEPASRWRTNLARGQQAREYESVEGDFAAKILAFMVQDALDEYKKANPDFPVSYVSTNDTSRNLQFGFRNPPTLNDPAQHLLSPTALWISLLLYFTSLLTKRWQTTFLLLRMERNTRQSIFPF